MAFGHPVSDVPVSMDVGRMATRSGWILNEVAEVLAEDDVADQAAELADILYFVLGSFVEIGVDAEAVFDIIHTANMSKVFPDGKVHYDSTGKVMKPSGFKPPKPLIHELVKALQAKGNVSANSGDIASMTVLASD